MTQNTEHPPLLTYTLARFDVEGTDVPAVWKTAAKNPGRYPMHRTCLLIHGGDHGPAEDKDTTGRAELIATDGRRLVRAELPCTVELPALEGTIYGAGRTRAVLLDSQALARAMKGRGRAAVTVRMREMSEEYSVTIERHVKGGPLLFGIPAEPYMVGGNFHGSDFPQVDAVMPAEDRPSTTVTLDRDILRSVLDAGTIKGDGVTIRISTEENGDKRPVIVEGLIRDGDARRSIAVQMPRVHR